MHEAASQVVTFDDVIPAYRAGSCPSRGHFEPRNPSIPGKALARNMASMHTFFANRIVYPQLAAAKCAIYSKIQYIRPSGSVPTADAPPVFRLDNPHVKRMAGGPPPSNYFTIIIITIYSLYTGDIEAIHRQYTYEI